MEDRMQKTRMVKNFLTITISFIGIFAIYANAIDLSAAELSKQQNLAELEGTWTLVKADMAGQALLNKDQQPPEITIKNGILTSDFKRASSELPLDLTKVVDPFKSPKLITLPVLRRFTFCGIYEVYNSELRICGDIARGRNSAEQRPSDFNDNQAVTLAFKRLQTMPASSDTAKDY
jgi:uncharacterized protein (TIGR03067 family)